jgi:hypothetical protein
LCKQAGSCEDEPADEEEDGASWRITEHYSVYRPFGVPSR